MDRNSSNIAVLDEPLTVNIANFAILDSPVAVNKTNKGNVERGRNFGWTKKGSGPMHLINKLATHVLNFNKSTEKKKVRTNETSMWESIVCSIRPLHLQSQESLRYSIDCRPPRETVTLPTVQAFGEDIDDFTPPMSPSRASSFSDNAMSQYASAVNLQELDDEGNVDNQEYEFYDGDETIDVKAELFIAQFYQQMRLQQGQADNN
ncbi:hypothetical protein JCGZ_13998 [Jatropha curcas]|uniref:Uncharacterized protein n=1 Tax=Jatropha curcas TaxID=180498 RepID=A0A067JWK3_JATCU|nr:uncharacterized protein LOC105642591 [Jatropha curcas]KDP28227.1 hypothetical protein JCGZ_13998 [Jatropha curcas]